jgi:hypothetical protein
LPTPCMTTRTKAGFTNIARWLSASVKRVILGMETSWIEGRTPSRELEIRCVLLAALGSDVEADSLTLVEA